MSEAEYKMLRTKNTLEAEEAMKFTDANESEGDQNGGTQAMRKANDGGKRIGVKDKVQFKRKKAKGDSPNIHGFTFLDFAGSKPTLMAYILQNQDKKKKSLRALFDDLDGRLKHSKSLSGLLTLARGTLVILQKESNDGSETIRSRSNKKRKRSHKGKKLEATNG
ncbi:hypothetical protein RHSIM_Rhsim09G0096800 [Rhododendron simsii]|uniref:Uncharacterized protein n=1 Tax=Rhododendron simsii TaxID=118357 RepID=A0A834LBN4_RHOSS|nr:hypothetical protein RHSIM_Rhsim09G0096800 [Rhododendron simsii]